MPSAGPIEVVVSSGPGEPSGCLDAWLCRPALFAPLLVLLGAVVSAWYLGYRFAGSDSGAILTAAARTLRGEVFYRDLDAYALPGATWLLALALGVFGEHVAVARALAGLLFCATLLALHATALTLMGRRSAAIFGLSLLGFKFVAWPSFTAYTYWDTAFCFACAAIALLVRHRYRGPTPALVCAGVFVGLAFLSKQNVGLYLGGAAGLLLLLGGPRLGAPRARPRARWTEFGALALGVGLVLTPLLLYFAGQGLLAELIRNGLVRPLVSYLPTSGTSFLEPLRWWSFGGLQGQAGFAYLPDPLWTMLSGEQLPGRDLYPLFWSAGELFARVVYTALPVAFAAALVLWLQAARRGDRSRDGALFTFAALAAAVVLTAFPRADFTHVISVYPLVWLLLVALWERLGPAWGVLSRRRSALQAGAVALGLGLCALLTALQHAATTHRMTLERADLLIEPDRAFIESTVRFLADELEGDDRLFVYGHEAYYYFLTGHFFPWPFTQLYPGQTGDEGGASLLARLRSDPPKLVVRGLLGMPHLPAIPSYAPLVEQYINERFEIDPRVFERYPLPEGVEPPPWWVLSVLRPCTTPPPQCDSLETFMSEGRGESPLADAPAP